MNKKQLHESTISYVKGKLEKEFDIQLTEYTIESEEPKFIDLISDGPGQDQKYAVMFVIMLGLIRMERFPRDPQKYYSRISCV